MHGNSSPDFNDSMSQHSFMAQIFNIDQVVCSWRKCNGFSKYAPAFTVELAKSLTRSFDLVPSLPFSSCHMSHVQYITALTN